MTFHNCTLYVPNRLTAAVLDHYAGIIELYAGNNCHCTMITYVYMPGFLLQI